MPNLNRDSAMLLARERINQRAQSVGEEFEIDSTMEIEQGWLFFYNTMEFVRTRDHSYALVGNGPILVTREGVVHHLPSAIPWEHAVKRI
jgi:Immunity protein 35